MIITDPLILSKQNMKSLKDYIKECGCGCIAATPMNTVGMGNVEPLSSDPVPTNTNILKKKKFRRQRKRKRHSSV